MFLKLCYNQFIDKLSCVCEKKESRSSISSTFLLKTVKQYVFSTNFKIYFKCCIKSI